jgi:cysteinyl-tRNA synthetase
MKLYNSLTNKIEEFKPISDVISIYSCGPTVYKDQHIGNITSFVYADTLHRALQYTYPRKKILHLVNFTDVDDKTIAAAKKFPDLRPKTSLKRLTRYVEKKVLEDFQLVGIDIDSIKFVRATEHIEQMQRLIKKLIDAGVAYVVDDGIYFSIENYKSSGKKYGQLVKVTAKSTGAARVNNDEYEKDQIHDFALWKAQKDDEPSWDFNLNDHKINGRPGWHVECSAMSTAYLGQPFDIHTGGVDLMFPHHENEIAQSTAATKETRLANIFFHSEHLLIEGGKMAKSKGNIYTLKDVIRKGYDPLAFRLFILQGHYKKQLNFSWAAMDAAQIRLNGMRNYVELSFQLDSKPINIDEILRPIKENLHTPKLLEKLDFSKENIGLPIKQIDKLLGLGLAEIKDAPNEIKSLIKKREEARKVAHYEDSDEIRRQLEKLKYSINDSPHGPIWQRIY